MSNTQSRLTYRSVVTDEAWQYKIREQKRLDWENSSKYKFWQDIDLSLKRARVREVTRKTAEKIILEYEWLGDMAVTTRFYGLFYDNVCGGVICIAPFGCSRFSGHKFGVDFRKTSYFARGACAFWTPKGSASKLLSWAAKEEGARGQLVAYGFADTDAGEYGTVYQASNWLCLGKQKSLNTQMVKGNRVMDTRLYSAKSRRGGLTLDEYVNLLKENGWTKQTANRKYLYASILAEEPEKALIMSRIKHLITDYPKRPAAAVETGSGDQSEIGGLIPTPPLQI